MIGKLRGDQQPPHNLGGGGQNRLDTIQLWRTHCEARNGWKGRT